MAWMKPVLQQNENMAKLQQKKSLLHCGIFISIHDQKDDKFEHLLPYVSTNTDMMSWVCYLKYNSYPFSDYRYM